MRNYNLNSLRAFQALTLLAALIPAAGTVAAEVGFPNRPIRLLVVSAPGGPSDNVARLVAPRLSDSLARNVVVDNRPSVTGVVACELAAKATADGSTLLIGNSGTHAVNASLYKNLPYDPVRDFAPVSQLVLFGSVLLANPKLTPRNFQELVAAARKEPKRFNIGVPGATGAFTVELLKSITGMGLTAVPYKGSAAALNDVIGGRVQLMFPTAATVMPHLKSDRLRILAVTTAQPSLLVPGLPTIAETLPGYESAAVNGVFAPAGTPPALVNRLYQEIARAVNRADVKEKFFNSGVEAVDVAPERFAALIRAEMVRMGKVIRDAGIRGE